MDGFVAQQNGEVLTESCSESCFNSILRDILSLKSELSSSSDDSGTSIKNEDWKMHKQQAISLERRFERKKLEKHRTLLSKVAEIEKRMKENRQRREALKTSHTKSDVATYIIPSNQIAANHRVTNQEPMLSQSPIQVITTCTDLLSRAESLSPSDNLLRSKIEDSVTSLHALVDQEEQLDEWYSNMADELSAQQMKLQQKFEEMKLNILTQKQRHIKQSHDYIDSLTNDPCSKSTAKDTFITPVKSKMVAQEFSHQKAVEKSSNQPNCASYSPQYNKINSSQQQKKEFELMEDKTISPQSNQQQNTSSSFLADCKTSTPTKSRSDKTPEHLKISRNSVTSKSDQYTNSSKRIQKLSDPMYSKLGSVVRGHLTRQLFKTGNIQTLVKTYKDSHLFLKEILKENRSTSSEIAQQQLKHHIKEEINFTRMRIHEMFFDVSLIQQIEMIRHSREIQKKHLQKKKELSLSDDIKEKKLSSASLKTIKRRQVSTDDLENVCPSSTEKTGRKRRTWGTRVLQPIPGKGSPKLKMKNTSNVNGNIASNCQSPQPSLVNDVPSSPLPIPNDLSKITVKATTSKRGLAAKFDKRVRTPVN